MNKRAVMHAEALVKYTTGQDQAIAIELRNRLTLPMTAVIERVPGATRWDQAKNAGVARQTLYTWLRNECRPSRPQAEKLEKITGLRADKIMGRRV
jgi:DNA-binding phage protein